MSSISENNKRIAKNTLLLYIRLLFTMGVSLYTSRVILQTLGIEDYGVYCVVGGIVAMFAFLNGGMISATQRFITFAIAEGDMERLKRVFSTSLQIHALISLIIVILAETIGLWFLYEKMIIPESRMIAALWVYQCSTIACVVNIMSVPYNANIVAHEKMSAFAYISILEVTLKLAIVYLLLLSSYDKLIVYAILMLFIQLLIRIVYARYCRTRFKESKYHHVIDKSLLKEMSSFAGYSFWGSFSVLCCTQGINLLLNMFFGPVVNAARGIAVTVQAAVINFSSSFQMALNPQIIKTYATGQLEEHQKIIFVACKFSALLIMIISLPILLETSEILRLWLGEVPNHTVNFVRIVLLLSIWDSTASPIAISIQATGQIRNYQLIISLVILLALPVSYLVFQYYLVPELALIVHLCVAVMAQFVRLLFLRYYIHLRVLKYIRNVYIPLIFSLVLSFFVPYLLFEDMQTGIRRFFIVSLFSVFFASAVVYLFALNSQERKFVYKAIRKVVAKLSPNKY